MEANRYPVFIPSKGRWDTRLTMRALDRIKVPYTVFVEPQEYDRYAAVIPAERLHILPHSDKGLAATRNYIWDFAQSRELPRFWTMDDNIRTFYRLNRNIKLQVSSGAILRAMEDFVDRYENVPIAGMDYQFFVKARFKWDPIRINTRIYSNMLIQTDARDRRGKLFRNECFFNDDTDLCLRVLKNGLCTVLFLTFLAAKSQTMKVSGGMTPYYQGDGRLRMAQELRDKHPDVTKIIWRFGHWQHHVDYRPFKGNRLKLKPGAEIPSGIDNYGMQVVNRSEIGW